MARRPARHFCVCGLVLALGARERHQIVPSPHAHTGIDRDGTHGGMRKDETHGHRQVELRHERLEIVPVRAQAVQPNDRPRSAAVRIDFDRIEHLDICTYGI
jgi:hypothetical protein